jgi:hypothetical protein
MATQSDIIKAATELAVEAHQSGYARAEIWPDGTLVVVDSINRDERTILPDAYRNPTDQNIQSVKVLTIVGTGSVACDCDACRAGDDPEDWAATDHDAVDHICTLIADAIREIDDRYWTATTAEQIAARFHDDGQRWKDDQGIDLDTACAEAGGKRDSTGERMVYRWTFADGSVITAAGGGWDLGYPDCYCWQGAGHTEDCAGEHAEEIEY